MKAVVLKRKYSISYGGWQDMQYVEDVAGTFIRCLEVPHKGARVYNLRGCVVDMPTFHRTLVGVEPEAAELVTIGERQLPIAFDLDDTQLRTDIAAIPQTPLDEGIRRTMECFRKLKGEGRLDASEL
jgi:nucleoside-diphosphate-sugar epimerase